MTVPLQSYNLNHPNKNSATWLADFRADAGDSSKILCVSGLDHQLPPSQLENINWWKKLFISQLAGVAL